LGGEEGERAMALSLRESLHLVCDPGNLDAAVEEVFQLMVGVRCLRHAELPENEAEPESVTAMVGFAGLLSGACVFKSGRAAAIQIAARLTGMEFDAIDDTVKDALGEICNMLAGTWKGRNPDLAAHCGLSIPAVVTGRDYHLRVLASEFKLHHCYCFEDARFAVIILCDGLK
jgi:chemotaxis protein CheX